jgi:hypothetical protein
MLLQMRRVLEREQEIGAEFDPDRSLSDLLEPAVGKTFAKGEFVQAGTLPPRLQARRLNPALCVRVYPQLRDLFEDRLAAFTRWEFGDLVLAFNN